MDYSEQTQEIETQASQPQNNEWMPLGVFALSKAGGVEVTPNLYTQLALNKNGILSGTLYNTTTNAVYGIEGFTNQASQRVVFKIADANNSPVLETGIYNLTQEETPVQVHFDTGQTQEIVLVRAQTSFY